MDHAWNPLSLWEGVVKVHPWTFTTRNRKNVIFQFLHFQWLMAIENGDASLYRRGCRLLRHPLWERGWGEGVTALSLP